MLSIRRKTYRGKEGYSIMGTDKRGRHVSVFTTDARQAKVIRDRLNADPNYEITFRE